MELLKQMECKSHGHSYYTRQYHSRKLYVSDLQRNTGKTCDKDNRCHDQVFRLSVVYLRIYKDADTRTFQSYRRSRNEIPPITGPGIVCISAESFPTNEQMMESTAAPPITRTL